LSLELEQGMAHGPLDDSEERLVHRLRLGTR
jgi:hypothetical protein